MLSDGCIDFATLDRIFRKCKNKEEIEHAKELTDTFRKFFSTLQAKLVGIGQESTDSFNLTGALRYLKFTNKIHKIT